MVPKGTEVKRGKDTRWVPPPPSVTKFNSDGAFNSSRSLAAFGVIARDSGGAAHCWRAGRSTAGSAIFIEAWALRIACATALEMNFAEVIFESDCLELVKAVTDGKGACPWEVNTMVEDINEWAKCRRWSFVWCCREKNKLVIS